jgi:hypothetical protein
MMSSDANEPAIIELTTGEKMLVDADDHNLRREK